MAKPLFGADKQHIHHKLLKLGLSQRETVLILYVVTAAFGFLSLIVLQDRRTIALVLAVIGIGVLIGVQQLRYQEFAEMASALGRFGRRRQFLANHVAIRQATERLSACDEMGAIYAILRDTLEPIGFDGIQLESERNQSLPMAMIKPLRIDSSGRLRFSWSGDEIACPTWEIRLEITSNAKERLGHLSLIRSCRDVPVSIDVNVLTNGFQTSLAGAVERVDRRMEAAPGPGKNEAPDRGLTVAAGARGD